MCSSPRLFAAYHGLLRTVAPRHPPWTLSRLTIFSIAPHSRGRKTARDSRYPTAASLRQNARASGNPGAAAEFSRHPLGANQRTPCFVHPSLELSKSTKEPPSFVDGRRTHPCGGFLHWRYGDLNPRPMACKATALATELYPRALQPPRCGIPRCRGPAPTDSCD